MSNGIIKRLVEIPTDEIEELSKAVAIAIEQEQKARDFYQRNAQKTSDPEIKNAFEFLVKEEQEHFDALNAIKDSLKEEGKFAIISEEALKHLEKPKIYPEKNQKLKKEKEENELTVLLWAMHAERKAELFYKKQAEKTASEDVKTFFEILAEFEAEHYEYLDGIFSSWTETSDFIMG